MNNIDGKKSEHYIKGFIKTMKDDYGVDRVKTSNRLLNHFCKLSWMHLIICFQRIMQIHIRF